MSAGLPLSGTIASPTKRPVEFHRAFHCSTGKRRNIRRAIANAFDAEPRDCKSIREPRVITVQYMHAGHLHWDRSFYFFLFA